MARKKHEAEIVLNKEISAGIFDMLIKDGEIASTARAGQFLMLYTKDSGKLLPRPISICDFNREEGIIRLVYRISHDKSGTRQFSALKAGETITVLGPIGNGYDIDELIRLSKDGAGAENADFWTMDYDLIVCGGGIGIPPMLGLLRAFKEEKPEAKTAAVLGFRNNDTFLADDFRAVGDVFFATDDGSIGTCGNVIDAMKGNRLNCDVLCACGPMPMLRGIAAYAREQNLKAFVSLEERMACGIGACLGCVTRTKNVDAHSRVRNARVCVDGPVFDTEELEL